MNNTSIEGRKKLFQFGVALVSSLFLFGCGKTNVEETDKAKAAVEETKVEEEKVLCENVCNKDLPDAIKTLDRLDLAYSYKSDDESEIEDPSDWFVVEQSIKPGEEIHPEDHIEITCKRVVFPLYFDFQFDHNILLSKYGVDVKLDGNSVGHADHGTPFSLLTKAKVGNHVIQIVKEDESSPVIEKSITVSKEGTLKGTIHTNNDSIELNEFAYEEAEIVGAAIEMPNVIGLHVEKATAALEAAGFVNIESNDNVFSRFIVTDANIKADETADKNDLIILTCQIDSEYLNGIYKGLLADAAEMKAKEYDHTLYYMDARGKQYLSDVTGISSSQKDKWKVVKCEYKGEDVCLTLAYCDYVEVPDLIGKTLAEATKQMESLKFSCLNVISDDNSAVWDTNNWEVTKQSVEPGKKVNADGRIDLTVHHIEEQAASSNGAPVVTAKTEPDKAQETEKVTEQKKTEETPQEEKVEAPFHSSGSLETAKKGNSGVFAYIKKGRSYDQYYIIDFDKKRVYRFDEGSSEDCECVKIKSGNLKKAVKYTYNIGGEKWSESLRFEVEGDPTGVILTDGSKFEWEFEATDLKKALEIRDKKEMHNY